MKRNFGNNGDRPRDDLEPTRPFPIPQTSSNKAPPRCNVAMPDGGGYSHEFGCLLRKRLLIAALITSAGSVAFFVTNIVAGGNFFTDNRWDPVLHGTVSAVLVLIATVLGSHLLLTVRKLRLLELTLFSVIALYFAWLVVAGHSHDRLMQMARLDPDISSNFIRLANFANILRWFGLIVIYGTFVPNTWKRCAAFVAVMAIGPMVLTAVTCIGCPIRGPVAVQSMLDMVILLSIASAIAIFGSHRIYVLQQEAQQAKQLGQYQLKKLIGSGGMGEVHLGEHVMLKRACAVKLIRPDQAGDLTSLSRFEREVRAMAKLTHWNTVEVYDYGRAEDGTFYYVMEYLPGMSLQDVVERYGPLPPARAVHFLRQVCDALQEAHGIGLIHRDIKPSNVLATQLGGVHDVAKLLDFGLVQHVGLKTADPRLTMHGTVLGSPPYMSPEQALGKKDLDARTDIYSLGGVAYFLLTGKPAFQRETPMQILMAHVHDAAPPLTDALPDIPEDVQEIVMRCLCKNRDDRFADAESLEQALAGCVCADDWTRRKAADWWRTNKHEIPAKLVAG